MSTSYNGTAASMAKDVASFVYRDSNGSSATEVLSSLAITEPAEPEPPTSDAPGISQGELSRLISEARAEGFREGETHNRAMYEKELNQLRAQISDLLSSFQQERTRYFSKVEVELVHFALAIAARILHREAQVDRMVVAGLVKVTIDKLQQGTKVILKVRPEEASKWRHYFHDNAGVQVLEDSAVEPGGCLLETDLGTADLGLDAQLKEVEKGFFDLLAQRPGAQ
jgi:flagellar biosynthesis/type III secretory pathway protein FliH